MSLRAFSISLTIGLATFGCGSTGPPEPLPPTLFETEMFEHELLKNFEFGETAGLAAFHQSEAAYIWSRECGINIYPGIRAFTSIDTLLGYLPGGSRILLGSLFHAGLHENWDLGVSVRELKSGDFRVRYGLGTDFFYTVDLIVVDQPMAVGVTRLNADTTNVSFGLTDDTGAAKLMAAHEFGHQMSIRHEDAVGGDLMYQFAGIGDTNITQAQCQKASDYGLANNYLAPASS